MNEKEFIKNLEEEKGNLETFFLRRGYSIHDVMEKLGSDYIDRFTKKLSLTGKINDIVIDIKELENREEIKWVYEAYAGFHKENVSYLLIELNEEIEDESLLEIRNYKLVLKDYVELKFENSLEENRRIFGA